MNLSNLQNSRYDDPYCKRFNVFRAKGDQDKNISDWMKESFDDAVSCYLKKDDEATPLMVLGIGSGDANNGSIRLRECFLDGRVTSARIGDIMGTLNTMNVPYTERIIPGLCDMTECFDDANSVEGNLLLDFILDVIDARATGTTEALQAVADLMKSENIAVYKNGKTYLKMPTKVLIAGSGQASL